VVHRVEGVTIGDIMYLGVVGIIAWWMFTFIKQNF
jgi:hypothetical protein